MYTRFRILEVLICLHIMYAGSWTHTQSLVSDQGSGDFSDGGVAVYGSTVAVGVHDGDDVEIYSDAGVLLDSVDVGADPKGVSMYDSVLAVLTDDEIFLFQKISSSWTQTSSHQTGTFKSVQIYDNFIVAGNSSTLILVVFVFINFDQPKSQL
jgi:hypothetical protein